MSTALAVRPLASWNAFTVRLDRDLLLLFAKRALAKRAPELRDLDLTGHGDRLLVQGRAAVGGVSVRFSLEVEEIRFKGGFLGFRLGALRGPLGISLPRFLVGVVSRHLPFPAHWDGADRILLFDLRRVLPEGFDIEVRDVRMVANTLEIHLGPGRLTPPVPSFEAEASEPPLGV